MNELKRQEMIEDLRTLKEFFIERSNATPVCLDYSIRSLEAWDEVVKHLETTASELIEREDEKHSHAFAKGITFAVAMIKNHLKGVEE